MLDAAFAFETGVATHPGRVRQQNEDAYVVLPDLGVWAVADGMGGHADGALASATVARALESIGRAVTAADLLARLEDRVLRADTRIKEVSRERGGAVIGTTVAVLLAHERHYACVWSGDSRVYRVRAGTIAQLSRDHTEVQELVDTGVLTADEARTWPRRNIITRALGVNADGPDLDLDQGLIEADDVFVLCSDGLTGHVADDEIRGAASGQAVQGACDALVALTLERGATDNVTIIVVRCRARGPSRDESASSPPSLSGEN